MASTTTNSVHRHCLVLSGKDLTIDSLYELMHDYDMKISVSDDAWDRVKASHASIQKIVENKEIVYGISTGFGELRNCVVPPDQMKTLQRNLITSHAVSTGPLVDMFILRGMLTLRINTLLNGNSGVPVNLIERLVEFFNLGIFSPVPQQSSVGASGDLAPLSNLILGYLGEHLLWDPKEQKYLPATDVLKSYNLEPLDLEPKCGLALNNGTQYLTTFAVEAAWIAKRVFHNANVVSALTLEALKGTNKAFDEDIHRSRPHPGQIDVAKQMRELLNFPEGSERFKKYGALNVQNNYSLRCIAQIHGATLTALRSVCETIEIEMNSTTDNPLIFTNPDGTYKVVSGGNFHGAPMALAADYLCIAMTTLGNVSGCRMEQLLNSSVSKLPSFLIHSNPGVNSGLMISQYAVAAVTSESRVLSNPSSVHSIPTCNLSEDHVSMGPFACRKLLQVVKNTAHAVACELHAACQAYEFTPEPTTPVLESVYKKVRTVSKTLLEDRFYQPEVEAVKVMVMNTYLDQ